MSSVSGSSHAPSHAPSRRAKAVLLGFIVIWFSIQIFYPLRHYLYPGNPSWTEEGHRFSWMMKLRDKRARAIFTVRDPATGTEWEMTTGDLLVRHQQGKVAGRPDMVLQYAHHIARLFAEQAGIEGVEVRVRSCVSLNGRPAALLIDPERDLVPIARDLGHADWILPLEQPFERPPTRTRRRDISC